PMLALAGQMFVGWNSDRTKERRFHVVVPIALGALALALAPLTQGQLFLTITCFMLAFAGFKAYMPAFWALPNLFLVEAAAAGSIRGNSAQTATAQHQTDYSLATDAMAMASSSGSFS